MDKEKPSLKIALCCPRFLWAGGGSVDHARRLAEELVELGHQVTIVSDGGSNGEVGTSLPVVSLPRDLKTETRAQNRLDIADIHGFYRFASWMNRSGRNQLVASGPWCPELANPKTFEGFDVVALLNAASAWTILFGRLLRKHPNAMTVVMPLFHVRETSGCWPVHRRAVARADLINTSTEFENEWLAERGWPARKLHAIGPAADPSVLVPNPTAFRRKYGIGPNEKLVLFLGRKVWNKGVIHVVQAMEHVWKKDPTAVLVLMGFAHNTEEWLKAYTRHATGRIINRDNASEQEREDALEACDVMAAPSISDSFGIVYLDAWRHGKPVIACTKTACASVVQHEENGLLVDFGDVPSIGNSLNTLLRSSEDATRMGRAGHDLWETRYTWQEVARRTESLYLQFRKSKCE